MKARADENGFLCHAPRRNQYLREATPQHGEKIQSDKMPHFLMLDNMV
jgi:hypothetical protein